MTVPRYDLATVQRLLGGSLNMTYTAERPINDILIEAATTWRVTASTTMYWEDVPADLADVRDSPEGQADGEAVRVPLVWLSGVTLDLWDEQCDAPMYLDGESADLAHFLPLLDGPAELNPDLLDFVLDADMYGGLTILNSAVVREQFRGHGLGRLVVATAIERHFTQSSVVALHPHPTGPEARVSDDHPAFQAALRGVRRSWRSIGFDPFTDDLYVKSPASAAGSDHARELRTLLLGRTR